MTTETLETVYLVEAADAACAEELALASEGEQVATDTSDLEVTEVSEDLGDFA